MTTDENEFAAEVTPAFAELGLADGVLEALRDVGYETPSAIQAATIPPLLEGRDVVGLAQTGTGKTAAFALPILSRLDLSQKTPQALVLAPTRELALQVCEAFEKYAAHLRGVKVLPVYGGQGYGVQLSALRRGVHIVVGTPGRIMDHLDKGTLDLSELRFLVLDEADEMLKMGFAEDVETILADTPEDKHVALFSATMPSQIRRISKKYLHDPVEITVKNKTTTSANITQRYLMVSYPQKVDALTRILEVENFEGMIVFVRTKNETETLAEKLRARGYSAAAINGDVVQAQRERTVNQLKAGKLDILVATDVAARGLDVERISHVVNYDIPTDTESYVHRIGRTGRAGRKGDAISFVTPRERYLLKAIEKATRQPLTPMQLPSVEDVNVTRLARFDDAISEALEPDHAHREVPRHHRPLRQRARRARGGRRRRARGGGPGRHPAAPRPRQGAPPGPRRASRSVTAPPVVTGPSAGRAGAPTSRWRRTGSRSASATRSSRARSSARSPTRAGSRAATSGTSRSARTSRWSSCPPSCPARRGTRSRPPASPASSSSCAATRASRPAGVSARSTTGRTRSASRGPRSRGTRARPGPRTEGHGLDHAGPHVTAGA